MLFKKSKSSCIAVVLAIISRPVKCETESPNQKQKAEMANSGKTWTMTLVSSMVEGVTQGFMQHVMEGRPRAQLVVPSVAQPVAEPVTGSSGVSMETMLVGAAGIGLGAMVSRHQKSGRTADEVMEIKDAIEEFQDAQGFVQVQVLLAV